MPDGSHEAHVPLSAEALDEAERQALIAAVAEARADPRPDIPHEKVRAEMLRDLEELQHRDDLPCPPRPVLDCRHG